MIYVCGLIFISMFCSCIVWIYLNPDYNLDAMFFAFSVTYGVLGVVYTVTIYYMLHTLAKLTDDGLKS